jgi:hypothetical protein
MRRSAASFRQKAKSPASRQTRKTFSDGIVCIFATSIGRYAILSIVYRGTMHGIGNEVVQRDDFGFLRRRMWTL